jgi:hypothetical protein
VRLWGVVRLAGREREKEKARLLSRFQTPILRFARFLWDRTRTAEALTVPFLFPSF